MFILACRGDANKFGRLGVVLGANPKSLTIMARVHRSSAQEFTQEDADHYANQFDMDVVDLDALQPTLSPPLISMDPT
jgi:hypothetical protein